MPPKVSPHYDDSVECRCGGWMVERRNHKTGEKFFGCTRFPECHHTYNERDMNERLGLFDPDDAYWGPDNSDW